MSQKKLAEVFYADLWGLREQKYKYLFGNDIRTTKGKNLNLLPPIDEINHYMKVARAIRFTIGFQERIDDIYRKMEGRDE